MTSVTHAAQREGTDLWARPIRYRRWKVTLCALAFAVAAVGLWLWAAIQGMLERLQIMKSLVGLGLSQILNPFLYLSLGLVLLLVLVSLAICVLWNDRPTD